MYGQPPPAYGMQPVQPPFQCRACGYVGNAMIVSKISTAGWITFVVLLICCLPLFWIGLLIRERKTQCPNCHVLPG